MTLTKLPKKTIALYILPFLTLKEVFSLSCVCQYFYTTLLKQERTFHYLFSRDFKARKQGSIFSDVKDEYKQFFTNHVVQSLMRDARSDIENMVLGFEEKLKYVMDCILLLHHQPILPYRLTKKLPRLVKPSWKYAKEFMLEMVQDGDCLLEDALKHKKMGLQDDVLQQLMLNFDETSVNAETIEFLIPYFVQCTIEAEYGCFSKFIKAVFAYGIFYSQENIDRGWDTIENIKISISLDQDRQFLETISNLQEKLSARLNPVVSLPRIPKIPALSPHGAIKKRQLSVPKRSVPHISTLLPPSTRKNQSKRKKRRHSAFIIPNPQLPITISKKRHRSKESSPKKKSPQKSKKRSPHKSKKRSPQKHSPQKNSPQKYSPLRAQKRSPHRSHSISCTPNRRYSLSKNFKYSKRLSPQKKIQIKDVNKVHLNPRLSGYVNRNSVPTLADYISRKRSSEYHKQVKKEKKKRPSVTDIFQSHVNYFWDRKEGAFYSPKLSAISLDFHKNSPERRASFSPLARNINEVSIDPREKYEPQRRNTSLGLPMSKNQEDSMQDSTFAESIQDDFIISQETPQFQRDESPRNIRHVAASPEEISDIEEEFYSVNEP